MAEKPTQPSPPSAPTSDAVEPRRMMRAELAGRHTHVTGEGVAVHVWRRGDRYLARGSIDGQRFGKTLGRHEQEAEVVLRQLLVDLDNGAFVRPSEAPKRMLKRGTVPRLDVRALVDEFLATKRRGCGLDTTRNYKNRLVPLIEFAERPDVRRRWPLARDIDEAFATEFRAYLHQRTVTPNGRTGASSKTMSASQIRNVLETARNLVRWASRPEVNRLPSWFVCPFNDTLIGPKLCRDPLAPIKLPVPLRAQLVQAMDGWELCTLAPSLVLPQRPEDLAGLLISDVCLQQQELVFGTRFGGIDFGKQRLAYRVPLPAQLMPLIQHAMAGRADGPLLRKRAVVEGKRKPRLTATTRAQIQTALDQRLARAKGIEAEQDRKRLFRRLLLEMGGIAEDQMAKTFASVLERVQPGEHVRFYETRSSVTTDMKDAGVDHTVRMYVTGHSLERQILAHYEHQDIHRHMARYFAFIEPLLSAVAQRAGQLGIHG